MIKEFRNGTFVRQWGDAPDVLMIHCTMGHSGAWRGVAEALNRPALAFDWVGHGRAAPWDQSQDLMEHCRAPTLALMEGRRWDLIGHSFGAVVSLTIAMTHPELVRRLILIEPVLFAAAAGTPVFESYLGDIRPYQDAIDAGNDVEAIKMFTAIWGEDLEWDALGPEQQATMRQQIRIVRAQDPTIFNDTRGLLAPGGLERLDCPVLLLHGSKSPPIVEVVNKALAARIPDARTACVEGGGHMVPISHPKRTAAFIDPFLSE